MFLKNKQISIPSNIINIFQQYTITDYNSMEKFEKYPIDKILNLFRKYYDNIEHINNYLTKFENKFVRKYLQQIITVPQKSIRFNILKLSLHIVKDFFNDPKGINLIIGNSFNTVSPILYMNDKYKYGTN